MTSYQLVLKNVFRNRRRSLLTAASAAVSILLLVVFSAAYRFLDSTPTPSKSHLVLVVRARASPIQPLPVSYRSRIERLPGVQAVTQVFWFDARYKDVNTVVPSLALDPERVFTIFPDLELPEGQKQQFIREETAAIVGRSTARKYGWKVGDHIYVSSPNYSSVGVDLNIRGIYDSKDDQPYLIYHWAYLNEALGRPNVTGNFWILAKTPEDVPLLMKKVDEEFRNSEFETQTMTVKQVMLDFISWLGNVKLILVSISGAVAFAVLLILANTMAMSIRERTSELAILRALGFTTRQVLVLLVAESLCISLAGALAGWLGARVLCWQLAGYLIGGALPLELQIGLAGVALALGTAAAVSLASTLIPAYRASRMSIAEALRYLG